MGLENRNKNGTPGKEPQQLVGGRKGAPSQEEWELPKRKDQQQQTYLGGRRGKNRKANEASQKKVPW